MQPYSNSSHPQPPEKNNNLLIILIAVLSVLVVAALVSCILFATGIFSLSDQNTESATAVITNSPTTAATALPTSNEVVQTTMYVANVKNSIYFRSAPTEDSGNIICEIPLASPVGFIENTDAIFAKVRYNEQSGWVKREYLSSVQPTAEPVVIDNTIKYTLYVANVKNSIYLRSTPAEISGNILGEIPLGNAVGYISEADGPFVKVNYNGTIGYCKSEYLSHTAPSTYSSGGSTMHVVNVKHSIYLRSAPVEESGNIICEIPVGSAVTFLENANGTFYKISWNGQVGYSKSEYLSW